MRERVTALLEWCWDDQYGGRSATEQSYHRIAELDRDLERTTPQLSASSALNTAPHTRQGAAERPPRSRNCQPPPGRWFTLMVLVVTAA
jgi:hypothetical protein